MKRYFNFLHVKIILASVALTVVMMTAGSAVYHYSSSTSFCILCHEMKFVAEQGWKQSPHFSNEEGVVAQCEDCHIPPEMMQKFWTKTRDGLKDVAVHTFGESDPEKMDWKELEHSARRKISDTSCIKCHENLTPRGSSIKTIVAHRAYLRMKDDKKCLDCHRESFHGKFKEQLTMNVHIKRQGGL